MFLKIDTISILAGSSNYPEWEQQVRQFLQTEDLDLHIEGEENNLNAPWPAFPFSLKIPVLSTELNLGTGGKMTCALCSSLSEE